MELALTRRTAIPNELIAAIRPAFDEVYQKGTFYRATGVVLVGLEEDAVVQLDLFSGGLKAIKMRKLFYSVDAMRDKYGKHTLYLGSSHLANRFTQHLGERGDEPERRSLLLKGETKRRRLGIPMFLGDVR